MIELTVDGDPVACRSAATAVRAVATALDREVTTLGGARCTSWTGASSEQYRSTLGEVSSSVTSLSQRIGPACTALEHFAGEIDVVKSRLAGVRGDATAAGLRITGDTVLPPTEPGDGAAGAQLSTYNGQVRAYNAAFGTAEAARTKETEAHTALVTSLAASNGDSWLENLLEKLGLAPPDGTDTVAGASYGIGLAGLGFGSLAGFMQKGVLGIWQPKFLNAQGAWVWGSNRGWSALDRLRMSLRPGAAARDFRALPNQAANVGRWGTAAKWAGRAGTGVTAATGAWSQWQSDADDPSLDGGERLDRAGTKGVSTAAGAWAGAQGGAWAGGAIGTAICPGIGTVIGGTVGGLVGGAAGALAGGAVGDYANEQWDGAVHAVGDGLGEVGDVASSVGDAISFWD